MVDRCHGSSACRARGRSRPQSRIMVTAADIDGLKNSCMVGGRMEAHTTRPLDVTILECSPPSAACQCSRLAGTVPTWASIHPVAPGSRGTERKVRAGEPISSSLSTPAWPARSSAWRRISDGSGAGGSSGSGCTAIDGGGEASLSDGCETSVVAVASGLDRVDSFSRDRDARDEGGATRSMRPVSDRSGGACRVPGMTSSRAWTSNEQASISASLRACAGSRGMKSNSDWTRGDGRLAPFALRG